MKFPETTCNRGRPREFCTETALDAALGVFWKHGYDGASLTELTDAMGISRPSLYAAFGDKQSLFRKAMDHYVRKSQCLTAAAVAEPTARGFVERLLRISADAPRNDGQPGGCFLVQSAMACSDEAAAVKTDMVRRRAELENLIRDRIERAVASGELPAGTDARELAMFFRVVSYGMSVRAAEGIKAADLHRIVDVAMRVWPVAPVGRSRRKLERRKMK